MARWDGKLTDSQLIQALLYENAGEMTKEACDACEQCGPLVMCRFHSLLSALARRTEVTPDVKRLFERDWP